MKYRNGLCVLVPTDGKRSSTIAVIGAPVRGTSGNVLHAASGWILGEIGYIGDWRDWRMSLTFDCSQPPDR